MSSDQPNRSGNANVQLVSRTRRYQAIEAAVNRLRYQTHKLLIYSILHHNTNWKNPGFKRCPKRTSPVAKATGLVGGRLVIGAQGNSSVTSQSLKPNI